MKVKITMTDAYQVWHRHRPDGESNLALWVIEPYPDFPGTYTHVASVDACTLEDVFAFTQDSNWQGERCVELVVDDMRSTMPGDVIVGPDGQAYRVECLGFSKIKPKMK
jgi:hypothetical protein